MIGASRRVKRWRLFTVERESEALMGGPVEVVRLEGFDPEGEPEIRVMADGRLDVVFNFMPPSWAEEDPERFADFDHQLARALGVPVVWEDREVFRVERPAADTIDRVRTFLRAFSR
jgi:hypothetical protein